MRPGLNPDDGFGARGQLAEFGAGGIVELVEHMADDEHADALIAAQEADAGPFDREAGKSLARQVLGEIQRERRVVVQDEPGEVCGAKELDDAPAGDATAAAPVEHSSVRWRRPAVQFQLTQDGVPLPTDTLAIGEVVALEVGDRVPVGTARRAGEEIFAQPVEHLPIERFPVHVAEGCL